VGEDQRDPILSVGDRKVDIVGDEGIEEEDPEEGLEKDLVVELAIVDLGLVAADLEKTGVAVEEQQQKQVPELGLVV